MPDFIIIFFKLKIYIINKKNKFIWRNHPKRRNLNLFIPQDDKRCRVEFLSEKIPSFEALNSRFIYFPNKKPYDFKNHKDLLSLLEITLAWIISNGCSYVCFSARNHLELKIWQ